MEKLWIKNRTGQNLVVIVDITKNSKGLVFVAHGLSGNKDQLHIELYADAFKEKGFSVVRFDTTNTFGESDGTYEDATVTNYFEDLEDVIAWSKNQEWYAEPFYLIGHSLGGMTTLLFAEKNPSKVKGVAPTSTVVSGTLSLEAPQNRKIAAQWQKTGWNEEKSNRVSDGVKRLPWSHMEDRLKYNVLNDAQKLTMPVLLIVGDQDDSTPLEHQEVLYKVLPGPKELHVIKGAKHTFIKPEHLEEIKSIIQIWIEKIELHH